MSKKETKVVKPLPVSENPPKGSGTPPPEIAEAVKEKEPEKKVIIDEAKQI